MQFDLHCGGNVLEGFNHPLLKLKLICEGLTVKHLGMMKQLRSSRRESLNEIARRQYPILESSWSQTPLRFEDSGLPRNFRGVRDREWIFQFSDSDDQDSL